MKREFRHIDLKLIDPPFNSNLTKLVMELNHLRSKRLMGTTPPKIFFQLKTIFHIIESIGSARIEGNRTTILEYVDAKMEHSISKDENIKEIHNMESALDFIDKNINAIKIDRIFLSETHKKVVKGLTTEGSRSPGEYRSCNPDITGSKLVLPDYTQVRSYMEELFSFINNRTRPQYDLLKTAIAHHRFAWIHPFDNGNGRTIRLFTYAMLAKQGFRIHRNRIINPTAVFCVNRNRYYKKLERADQGDIKGMLEWCEYVLQGLKREVEKVDLLTDYDYVRAKILLPAIVFSFKRQHITEVEMKILKVAINIAGGIKNSDIQKIFPKRNPADISRLIRNLRRKKMLASIKKRSRKYVINFESNYLIRGTLTSLGKEGFLPLKEEVI